MKLRLAGITKNSVVDGPGMRIVIYAQGCPHGCQGCHNAATHDADGGYSAEIDDVLAEVARALKENRLIRGVTFSGGEPFAQSGALARLAPMIKGLGLNIITYTGYTFEKLLVMGDQDENVKALLTATDILVDGPYLAKERDLLLAYRGSRNQRLIDVKASLAAGEVVLCGD